MAKVVKSLYEANRGLKREIAKNGLFLNPKFAEKTHHIMKPRVSGSNPDY